MTKTDLKARIKAIRLKDNLTQSEFAKAIGGVQSTAISHWERGVSEPSRRNLARIAKYGGIEVHELLGINPEEKQPVTPKVLGNRIRRIRNGFKFTQKEFGELLDVSCITIINWEKGKNVPQTSNLEKIADLVDMDVDSLIYRKTPVVKTGKSKPVAQTTATTATPTKVEAVQKPVSKIPVVTAPVVSKPTASNVRKSILASEVLSSQLEDEITTFKTKISKQGYEKLWEQSAKIETFKKAFKKIIARIKNKEVSSEVYLGKNAILEKIWEYSQVNPDRAINDDLLVDFEKALTTVYN